MSSPLVTRPGRLAVRFLVSLSIAAGLVWWLVSQGFEVVPSPAEVRRVAPFWSLASYVALFSAFHFLRAWRWRLLVEPLAAVRSRVLLSSAFAGFALIQVMPLRTGELARPYLLDRYAGVSKSAALGTVAVERVVDGLMVSLCLSASLLTVPPGAGPYVWGLRLAPAAVFLGALLALLAFHRWPKAVSGALRRVLGGFSHRLADFVGGVVEKFHSGLASLPDAPRLWRFVAASAAYWGVNATAFWVLARGCGIDLPFAGAVAGMGCLAVGILLPAGPGYFGNFQIAVVAALQMFVAGASIGVEAEVFVFVLYVLQTGATIVFGLGGWLGLRSVEPVRRATTSPPSSPSGFRRSPGA
jgi:glycosyltransferase 2 family protein